jgi:phospholipase C
MSSYGKAIGAALLLTLAAGTPASAKKAAKFNHVVVVMMENRSFDHLLGWLPGADGMQAGLEYPDDLGVLHPTAELAPDFQGCGRSDPDHSYEGGRIDLNGGQMNGFLLNTGRATANDDFAIGYYGENDRPFFNSLALNYTTFDNFFSPILAETYPNRIFMHAAQTDRPTNTLTISTLPTIWDRLKAKGVSARYYRSDFSFLWLWGTKYDSITFSHDQFLKDAKNGNLPKVAFVEPRFAGEEQGISNDDHPHADIRAGDAFLAEAFRAVSSGPS